MMKSILAAQFWNQEVESTQSLNAVARTLPSEPPPIGMTQPTKLCRAQQLLLLQRLLAVPFTPSYAVDNDEGGGLVLDRVISSAGGLDWWATLTGRLRAQRLLCRGKEHRRSDKSGSEEDSFAKRLVDPSLYALCGSARARLSASTILSACGELGSLKGLFPCAKNEDGVFQSGILPFRGRASLRHKFDRHQLTLETAFHERCVDREAHYWDVPRAVSLDLASVRAPAGIRYRVGVHKISEAVQSCDKSRSAKPVPQGALPGTRAQAAMSIEREISVWKDRAKLHEKKARRPYNLFAARPQITIGGIVGGLVSMRLWAVDSAQAVLGRPVHKLQLVPASLAPLAGNRVSADLFASLGATAQFGSFERPFLDHTSVGFRVDMGAATAFAAAAARSVNAVGENDLDVGRSGQEQAQKRSRSLESEGMDQRGYPMLAVTMQQQVAGPVRARVDARFGLDPVRVGRARMLEATYGVDVALASMGAAKLVIWYSPTRREGMAELRLLER
ncbi:hypothetical protein CBR_g3748 [Chara braunii]|uniref:Uncharacterized protein n=1 Tax=Chara braunii TaxID=69332 RepID=A0A388KG58_CHABU|nr:hypothetical protein CBR_g3748 [Chara braunii]|eukprot:GBG69050.1 hypothetical protein CBR_g3748 [Chara braunii]